jgi:hypothetical protein
MNKQAGKKDEQKRDGATASKSTNLTLASRV